MRTVRVRPIWVLFLLPILFLLIFFFYPLYKILILSLVEGGVIQLDKVTQIFTTPTYARILWFTVWQAALSTLLTVLLALPSAYIFAKYHFVGKNLLQALMIVPFVMPTVVTASAFRALLSRNGVINSWLMESFNLTSAPIEIEQTVYFFLIAHVFYNYTLVVRIVSAYWSGIDNNLIGAAKTLGASPWTAFTRITLPLLLPAIGSAALLVFMFCFTSFGVILILGGPGYSTIEVEIYRQAVQLFNLPMAATLSIIQIGFNFVLLWIHGIVSKRSKASFFSTPTICKQHSGLTPTQKVFLCLNLTFLLLLIVSPLCALVLRSITNESGLTLTYYSALFSLKTNSIFFVKPFSAVMNSISFAIASLVLALPLGLITAQFLSRLSQRMAAFWDALIMLPIATSAVTLGFGYIITLNEPPLNLRDSLVLVPLAHTLVAFPFVVRCILPTLRQLPSNLRESAAILGASPFVNWRTIELPLIKNSLLVGAIFSFCISMGEFGASTFVSRPHTPTMPVAIFRFLNQPGAMNYGQAMAMSTILMIVTCSSFWFIAKLDNLPIEYTSRKNNKK